MKHAVIALVLVGLCSACAKSPVVRARNERSGTEKASIQMQPSFGRTLTITDVQPGSTTAYMDAEETVYRVQASISGTTSPPDTSFTAESGRKYTIVVLDGPPTLRVDVSN